MPARKTLRSRRLGSRIKALREAAGLSQDGLTELIGHRQPGPASLTQPYLSRIESGQSRPSAGQLALIIEAIGADPATAAALEELRSRADERGWWQDYSHLLPDAMQTAIELEEDARTARTYDAVFIQGLLQTRDYARVLIESGRAFIRPIHVDALADVRMRRQRRLSAPSFAGLTVVISEAALRHVVGGRSVMIAQLQRLRQVVEEGKHAVHVLPYARGPWPGISSFVLYDFADPDDPEMGHVDSDFGPRIYEDRESLNALNYMFHAAVTQALSASESLDVITNVIDET